MNNMVTAANKDKVHRIREAEATTGRIVVRYIYSNKKICDSPELSADLAVPVRAWRVLVSPAIRAGMPRKNRDRRGNVGQLIGPASEVNYTGKNPALSQPRSGFASLCVRRILESRLWGEHGEANLQSPETGLYYFNQRYYGPSLGCFLTEDPAGQGLNPYAYAGMLVRGRCCELPFATSLSLINPDGEWFWIAGMIIGGVIGGWGKDLSKMETWGSIALGAAVGAMAGAGLDYVAANAGLSVKIAADLPYVGQVNLASMDFVGSGLVAAGGAAARGGGETQRSRYEDPGLYLPGSGPGERYRPGTGELTSPFQIFRDWDQKPHLGNDFGYGDGFVYARYTGVVQYAGMWISSGFGNQVRIQRSEYPDQYNSYSHLKSIFVQKNDFVVAGQKIGIIGGTSGIRGVSYTPHLHYAEFTIDADGKWRYWDPGY